MASGGVDLYNQLNHLDVDSEASRRGIYHRHWIEQRAGKSFSITYTINLRFVEMFTSIMPTEL